ncbi:MAG TPA: CBS domain-containing protein [Nitrospirota bacterium]|nr:CBS domain-containing protein [Nitrospirota bacterium]
MKIADIMTKQVHTIGPDQTLKECAEILRKCHVNGLVVVDGGTVTGVITKADIFKAVLPGYSDIIEDTHYMVSFEYIEDRAHRLYDLRVRDLMGTPPITITGDTPIVKAGSLMILRRVKQLPVVDTGRLSGIVTLTDIINYITDKIK